MARRLLFPHSQAVGSLFVETSALVAGDCGKVVAQTANGRMSFANNSIRRISHLIADIITAL
jgi:hypothetical protein